MHLADRYLNTMIAKGLIVLPSSTTAAGGPGGASMQRVGNRPIVCHVLDELLRAGVVEVAAVAPSEHIPKLRECLETEGPAGLELTCFDFQQDELFQRSLAAAAAWVGERACIVHLANGLLGQPLSPLLKTLDECSADMLAVVCQAPAGPGSMALPTRRALRLAEAPVEERGADLAGVCVFGPGALLSASSDASVASRDLRPR